MNGENKFQVLYDREKEKVNKVLSRSLEFRKPESLYSPAYYIIQNGGKRLRPLLVLFSCKANGGKFSQCYNAAASVELLHNFTLVHDDIMDNAEMRRGMQTLHVKYDLSTGVLAGDSMLAVAYEYLLKDCRENASEILAEFNNALLVVCEGQALDKIFEVERNVKISDYLEMIEKKTAALLIMCCKVGGMIAEGSTSEIKALASFGKNLGLAFQIQDDLLDIKGYKEFGKKTGGDLMEGKKTFLFLKALELSTGSDRSDLEELMEQKGIEQSRINYYIDIYKRNGVVEAAENEVVKFTKKAIRSVNYLNSDKEKKFFIWLANSLIERNN